MEKQTSGKKAICVITRRPHEIWLDFLSACNAFDTYLLVDDNDWDYGSDYQLKYPSVKIIQMDSTECEARGFTNLLDMVFYKTVTGWEKAIFYFSNLNKAYKQVWFFEDDVFIYNENTIRNIDKKFPDSDLLTAPYQISTKTSKNWFWWPRINIDLPPPYYNAMICGIRVSAKFLSSINAYAQKHGKLFFLEVMFPTIAIKGGMRYDNPKKMIQIYYAHRWKHYNVGTKNIFHPVKDPVFHHSARRRLKKFRAWYAVTFLITNAGTGLYKYTKHKIRLLLNR